MPTLVKTVENGRVVYSRPHQAKLVTDSADTPLFLSTRAAKSPTPDLTCSQGLNEPETLQKSLGVHIDPEALRLALTHRSYAYENDGLATNERLEFLGDAVLQLVVTDYLFRTFGDLAEGDLAKLRPALVSTRALARIARTLTWVHISGSVLESCAPRVPTKTPFWLTQWKLSSALCTSPKASKRPEHLCFAW